jgi:predicted ATPase
MNSGVVNLSGQAGYPAAKESRHQPGDPMLHLRSISYSRFPGQTAQEFPFNLPVIQSLQELAFTSPVTFFVGENGSGKSTLLEAIACAVDAITIGSENIRRDKTLTAVRRLSQGFKLAWQKRSHRGFFLRAEDFFGYARRLNQMREELESDLKTVDDEYQGRSKLAVDLAKMPYQRELGELQQRYGNGLDSRSHGESFLALFQARFVPNGLYLLDEPEAPLSPLRQLAFLSLLKEMVDQNAQFIIATHSPIILAFPGATILSFDKLPLQAVNYADLEHVTLTRTFLDDPEAFLRRL